MPISTLEQPLTQREERDLWGDDRQERAEAQARDAVMDAVRHDDLGARVYGDHTLRDALAGGLEWMDGTATTDLLRLLVNAANGHPVAADARNLIRECARRWARMTIDVGDE